MKPTLLHRFQKFGIKIAGLFILLVITTITVKAQSPPGLPAFPDEPSAAPIDGGLSLLAAAGGAYAIKKLRDKKKGEEEIG